MTSDLVYNPYAFAVHDDPSTTDRRLSDEAPAYWNDELEFWALSRFEDVLEGFRDFATLSSANGVALDQRGRVDADFRQMIDMDPPEHTAFRKLVSRVFTGRRVAEMEDEIRRIFGHHLDAVVDQGSAQYMHGTLTRDLDLHRRIPDYTVDHDTKIRFHSGNVTGWTSLPITFTPSPSTPGAAPSPGTPSPGTPSPG